MTASLSPLFAIALLGAAALPHSFAANTDTVAAQAKPPAKPEPKGDWLQLRPDGQPYFHDGTGLGFPQHLGDYALRVGFRDNRSSAGVALSYFNEQKDIRASINIYPTPSTPPFDEKIVEYMQAELSKLIADTRPVILERGYQPPLFSPGEVMPIKLWKSVDLPLLVIEAMLEPADPSKKDAPPRVAQWIGLTMFQDHFIHCTITMSAERLESDKEARTSFINSLLQCLREPSIKPEMLKLCETYMKDPLDEKSRQAADALLSFTKESPVYELVFPGEALTPALNEMQAQASGLEMDLLRGYVVGAAVVNFQRGDGDAMIEEGARILCEVYKQLRRRKSAPVIAMLEQLCVESAKQGATAYLKPRSATGIQK